MGATFAAVGSGDLAGGLAPLQTTQAPPAFSWLSLNLVDPVHRQPLFTPMALKQVGSVRIAILALTDHEAARQESTGEGFQVLDWHTTLPPVVAQAKEEADCLVLLSNYDQATNMEIARSQPAIDLILQTGHVVGNLIPVPINTTLIAQTEIRGKYLGVLDIDWQGHGPWTEATAPPPANDRVPEGPRYRNQFVPLRQALPTDPAIETLVRQAQLRMGGSHGNSLSH